MDRDTKLYLGWEYVCKPCKLVYQVYGSRHTCDLCNRDLKLVPPEEAKKLLSEWEAEEKDTVKMKV